MEAGPTICAGALGAAIGRYKRRLDQISWSMPINRPVSEEKYALLKILYAVYKDGGKAS
jgi:hypothetical protein